MKWTFRPVVLICALLVIGLGGCQKEDREPLRPPPRPKGSNQKTIVKQPEIDIGKAVAVIETEKGKIEIRLLHDKAPKTVENFVKNVKTWSYDHTRFHRVVSELLIQAGAPFVTGSVPIENTTQDHIRGVVGMAKAEDDDPESDASDFYICLDRIPNLNGKYTVFGEVILGMEVVDQIVENDKIVKVTLRESSE